MVLREQRGITGLETAIVLIAFVVVASVFAFAHLSTGLFATDKAKETIKAGLSEARGTMELKGSIIGTSTATGSSGVLSSITFQVTNAAAGEAVDLTPGNTILRYFDDVQSKNYDGSSGANFSITGMGNSDGDNLLERGEVYEITLQNLQSGGSDALDTELGTDTQFTIEVIPPKGAVLYIQRTTPISFETINSLD
ncbi:MAG: archaellin/type IV pilin N-terminal domain-containing protein [Dehalococcoidia bacterium]